MQYAHMPERRDSNLSNLDSAVSTPFQSHQSLGQALGGHPHLSHAPHPGAGSSHGAPLTFSVTSGQTSPGIKRKPMDGLAPGAQVQKRRREGDDVDPYDADPGGQGAKHWTDEEKSRLFNYLMGPGQDDHWNSLRATKNSCLRECANDIFGGKKTYQALKGCYERNFNLFKQIYAFELYHQQANGQANCGSLSGLSEADRLREIDRRLQMVRKAGVDVGNINPRTIDQWHRNGWYDLFYRRWHGDPATTRPITTSRPPGGGGAPPVHNVDDQDGDDDNGLDFADPSTLTNQTGGMNGLTNDRNQHSVTFINPQTLRDTAPMPHSPVTPLIGHPNTMSPPSMNTNSAVANVPPPPSTTSTSTSNMSATPGLPSAPNATPGSDQSLVNVTLTQGMVSTYLQFLQVQTQTSKMKLEYMRRREEREEREGSARREIERLRQERETAEFEHNKQSAKMKQKADRAIEVLGNPSVDPALKQAASDYLKKLFVND